ncbi:MAG: tetratricopeptide repeat protein [Theionarchaea archaeon]|nr:tetratricopeptide repeat protein [Theionarchaea archaeon]
MVRSEPAPLPIDRAVEKEGILSELELLTREIEISQGRGNLIILVVNEPYLRDLVVDFIGTKFRSKEIVIVNRDQISRMEKEEGFDVFLWQLPEIIGREILNALNFRRELFYETDYPHAVICNEGVMNALIRDAPDFWRYKASYHILHGSKPVIWRISTFFPFFSYKTRKEVNKQIEINEYLLGKSTRNTQKAFLLLERAQLHQMLYQYEKAITYYRDSLEILEKINDEEGAAKVYHGIGIIHQVKGQYEKALEYYNKSLSIFEKVGDMQGAARIYGELGTLSEERGQYERALEYYNKSLSIFEQVEDIQGAARIYYNIGNNYRNRGKYEQSLEYYRRSLKNYEELGDPNSIAKIYYSMGTIYGVRGEYKKALEYYSKSLSIFENLHNTEGIAATDHQIKMIHEDTKEYKSVES